MGLEPFIEIYPSKGKPLPDTPNSFESAGIKKGVVVR
jgi:hypothetical protein